MFDYYRSDASADEEEDDDEDDGSSSCSGRSEVLSLPDFLPFDDDDSGEEEGGEEKALFQLASHSSLPHMPPSSSFHAPVIHQLEPDSMLRMEQWLTQWNICRSPSAISIHQPSSTAFSQTVRVGKHVGKKRPHPIRIRRLMLRDRTRHTSDSGSPTGSPPKAAAVSILSMRPKPLLMLPAPPFRPQALEVGVFCEKGHRLRNEDMAFAMRLEPASHQVACFNEALCCGVFDGHGGVEVASMLTELMPDLLAKRSNRIKQQGVKEV